MEQPIDLVGHDWGGGHVHAPRRDRPDLIRSWVTDIAGCADPEYVWHDMAQVWQTPGAGDEAVAAMAGMPVDDLIAAYVAVGMSEASAGLGGGREVGRDGRSSSPCTALPPNPR